MIHIYEIQVEIVDMIKNQDSRRDKGWRREEVCVLMKKHTEVEI